MNLTSYFVKAEGLNTKSVHLAGPVHLVVESLANGLTYIGNKDQNGADITSQIRAEYKKCSSGSKIMVDIQPVNDAPNYSTWVVQHGRRSETILSGIIL